MFLSPFGLLAHGDAVLVSVLMPGSFICRAIIRLLAEPRGLPHKNKES